MKKLYLDTSVPSAYFDEAKPERKELTREFWRRLNRFNVVISRLTLGELDATQDRRLKAKLARLVLGFDVLEVTEEADVLTEEYIKTGIVPAAFRSDALHIAIAVTAKADYLVSWNFKHLVNVSTREQVNKANQKLNYPSIQIIAPPEV